MTMERIAYCTYWLLLVLACIIMIGNIILIFYQQWAAILSVLMNVFVIWFSYIEIKSSNWSWN
jgi:hypothetical protein